MTIVAVVPSLMDRSRFPEGAVQFVTAAAEVARLDDVTGIVIDLDRCPDVSAFASMGMPSIGFGSHVEDQNLDSARAIGVTEVLPRSIFFRRLPELLGTLGGSP